MGPKVHGCALGGPAETQEQMESRVTECEDSWPRPRASSLWPLPKGRASRQKGTHFGFDPDLSSSWGQAGAGASITGWGRL